MKRIFMAAGIALALAAGGCAEARQTATTAIDGIAMDQSLHDRLPDNVRNRGAIRLMTDASYAPMEQFAADGRTIIGFEPDLADALGSLLGIEIEMVQGVFSTALDDMADGEYDGVLSSMTDTLERQKKADFVDYFTAGTSIIVQRGNPARVTDLKSLCGKVVGTERGTVQADLLRRTAATCGDEPMVIHEYRTNADALLELRTGRAAAVLNDFPPAAYLASDEKTSGFYQLASSTQYETGLFGVAIAKDNPELRDAVHAALNRLIESGTYAELLQRWDLRDGAVAAASINAATR